MDPAPTLAVSQGDGSIILTWESISDTDITSVRILRSTYLTGGYTEIKSIYDKTVTTYTDVISDMDQVYYYKLRVSDAQSNTDESNVVWSKAGDDMTPPQISSISIPDEAKWGGPSISFYVLATDNRAVTDMNAFYSLDDGETWTPMLSTKTGPTLSGGNYQTSYAWNTEGFSSGIYRIKVVAEDAAGYEGTLK